MYVYKRNDVLINLTGNFTDYTCTCTMYVHVLKILSLVVQTKWFLHFKTQGKKDSTTYMYMYMYI